VEQPEHVAAASSHAARSFLRTAAPVLAVGVLLGVIRAEAPLGDSDVLWGARAGMDVLSSGHLPHHATYSWTAAGRSWTPNSWGWDVVLGAAHDLGGMTAIGFLDIAMLTLLAGMLAAAAFRIGAHAGWIAITLAVVGRFVLPDLRPRPQLVAYPMILAFTLLVPRALSGDRRQATRAAALLIGLQVLWINLHTSALFGPAVIGVGGVGLLLRERAAWRALRPRLVRLAGLVAAAAAACLATPYGTALITNVNDVRDASVGLIAEWEHAGIHGSTQILGLVAIAVALAAAYPALRGRRYDTVGYLLLFAAATASAVRFTPILFVLAMPEVALLLGRLRVRESFLLRTVAAGCLVLAVFAGIRLDRFGDIDEQVGSPSLVAVVPHGCRVVNDYTIGGALMLARPDVRVSVDGRNDMYGRSLLLTVEGWLDNEPGTLARIDTDRVTCVLTESGDRLVSVLTASPDWRVVGTDDHRTLLVRVSS
jgi:hypothetical protein